MQSHFDNLSSPLKRERVSSEPPDSRVNHALHSIKIAGLLGIDIGAYNAVRSELMSYIFSENAYLLPGYRDFGYAVKGFAIFGFWWEAIKDLYREYEYYEQHDKHKINDLKKQFLRESGVTEGDIESNDDFLDDINIYYLAIRNGIKNTKMTYPSSGSFAYAALRAIEIARKHHIQVGNIQVPVLRECDGLPSINIPDEELEVMEPAKLQQIVTLAKDLNLGVRKWTERERRDPESLLEAIKSGGLFCPTNPKSSEEVLGLLNDPEIKRYIKNNYGENKQNIDRALERLHVHLYFEEGEPAFFTDYPIIGGYCGLMAVALYAFNTMNQSADFSIYNQPSVGATAGAIAEFLYLYQHKTPLSPETEKMFMELLPNGFEKYAYHDKVSPRLRLTVDSVCSSMAKHFRLDKKYLYEKLDKAVNGLGTFSTSAPSSEFLDKCAQERDIFYGKEDIIETSHTLMNIASLVVLAENHYLAELAGATSLAGRLQELIDKDSSNFSTIPKRIGQYVSNLDVDGKFLKDSGLYNQLVRTAEQEGPRAQAVVDSFMQGVNTPKSLPLSPLLLIFPTTYYCMTGSNGKGDVNFQYEVHSANNSNSGSPIRPVPHSPRTHEGSHISRTLFEQALDKFTSQTSLDPSPASQSNSDNRMGINPKRHKEAGGFEGIGMTQER